MNRGNPPTNTTEKSKADKQKIGRIGLGKTGMTIKSIGRE